MRKALPLALFLFSLLSFSQTSEPLNRFEFSVGTAPTQTSFEAMLGFAAVNFQKNGDEITFDNTGYSVRNSAFKNTNLVSIKLHNSVASIGDYAFEGNILKRAEIPTSVNFIGYRAFYNAFNGGELIFLNPANFTIKEFGSQAFQQPSGHRSIVGSLDLPHSLEKIEANAFVGSAFNGTITIPKNVMQIGYRSFHDVFVGGTLIFTDPQNSALSKIDNEAFRQSSGHRSIVGSLILPKGVKEIGAFAFQGCALTEVSFPTGLLSIGQNAFEGNILKKAEIPTSVNFIGYRAFYNAFNGGELIFLNPANFAIKEFGSQAFQQPSGHRSIIGSLELPYSLEKIEASAFVGNAFNGTVSIPKTVKEIGAGAFHDVFVGGTLIFTDPQNSALTTISDNAFRQSSGHRSIVGSLILPKGVKEIGAFAFQGCALIDVSLPAGLLSIGQNSFEGNILKKVEIPSSVNFIGYRAFYNAFNGGELVFLNPANFAIKEFGSQAFQQPSGHRSIIGSLELPYSLEKIEASAFVGNAFNGTVSIPKTVKEIGYRAFHDVFVGGTLIFTDPQNSVLTAIGNEAFRQSSGHRSIVGSLELPFALENIGSYAFADNKFDGKLIVYGANLGTVGDDNIFRNSIASSSMVVEINESLLVNNNGSPDGDVAYLMGLNIKIIALKNNYSGFYNISFYENICEFKYGLEEEAISNLNNVYLEFPDGYQPTLDFLYDTDYKEYENGNLQQSEVRQVKLVSLVNYSIDSISNGFKYTNFRTSHLSSTNTSHPCLQSPNLTPELEEAIYESIASEILSKTCNKEVPTIQEVPISFSSLAAPLCPQYDESGNQIGYIDCAIATQEQSVVSEEEIPLADKIYIAPNPTKGEVIITWDQSLDNSIVGLTLVSYSTGLMMNLTIDTSNQSAAANLSSQPPGLYYLEVMTQTGETASKTIIRN